MDSLLCIGLLVLIFRVAVIKANNADNETGLSPEDQELYDILNNSTEAKEFRLKVKQLVDDSLDDFVNDNHLGPVFEEIAQSSYGDDELREVFAKLVESEKVNNKSKHLDGDLINFKSIDQDDDQNIDWDEYHRVVYEIMNMNDVLGDEYTDFTHEVMTRWDKTHWKAADHNKDGVLNANEFRNFLSRDRRPNSKEDDVN